MRRVARGSAEILSFCTVSGDPTVVSAVTARIRRSGGATLQSNDESGQSLTATPRAAAPGLAAGWDVLLSSGVSAGLRVGTYWVDLVLTIAGNQFFCEPTTLQIYEAPSSP